jgi:vitamin B12 transporter
MPVSVRDIFILRDSKRVSRKVRKENIQSTLRIGKACRIVRWLSPSGGGRGEEVFQRFFLLITFSIFSLTSFSQSLTDTLKEIKVREKRKKEISNDERINTFSPGQKVTSIDSIILEQYEYQNVANLVSQQTTAFVRSYGVNSMATLNLRGSSAAQSQVYWNGVPIQNAASGIADVSILPVSVFNKVNIIYGGSSALWGSGNVGGALMLENNRPVFDKQGSRRYELYAAGGSFHQYQAGIKAAFSNRKWYTMLTASGQKATNDFPYNKNGTELKMNNAHMQSGTAVLQTAYKLNVRNTFSFTGWYQQYYREIPPALFETNSVKRQRDESLRLLLDWTNVNRKKIVFARASFLADDLRYRDSAIFIDSRYTTNTVFAEVGTRIRFNAHHRLMVFVPLNLSLMERKTIGDIKSQGGAALAAAYALNAINNKLECSFQARSGMLNQLGFLLPGMNLSYRITNWFTIRGNIQRSFRAPTLHELYYVPGGNDLLKPERGWSTDIGYSVKTNDEKQLSLLHDVSLFNRRIKDWIIWFGGAIWTPHNIASVHSRGVETENKLQLKTCKWKFYVGLNTSYCLATTEESYIPGDGSVGRQIAYSPRYNGQVNAGFHFKGLSFNYNHCYTGYRFITTDESAWLQPYNTANLQLLYSFRLRNMPVQLTAQGNNIFNERYAVVANRPMPGISWLAGLKLTIE